MFYRMLKIGKCKHMPLIVPLPVVRVEPPKYFRPNVMEAVLGPTMEAIRILIPSHDRAHQDRQYPDGTYMYNRPRMDHCCGVETILFAVCGMQSGVPG